MKKATLIFITLIAILILPITGCKAPNGKTGNPEPETVEKNGLPVKVQAVSKGSISLQIATSGILEGWDDITLTAEVGGTLEKIHIDEGLPVKKGELILEIEHASLKYQLASAEAGLISAEQTLKTIENGVRPEKMAQINAQLESAKINFKNAEANFARMQELFDEGVISKAELDGAESQLAGAKAGYETALKSKELADIGAREEDRESVKAAVENAKAQRDLLRNQYNKAFFHSPIDGTVAFIYVEKNEMVSPGMPLINVVTLDKLKLPISLNAVEAADIKVGSKVEILPESFAGEIFTGSITKVDVKADIRTGTFGAEIAVTNTDGRLMPGMTASAKFQFGGRNNIIVIPLDAIVNRGLSKFVFVADGNRASIREVFTGIIDENKAEIISGLKVGQSLIIEGHKNLKDGDTVAVIGEEN
ncbi:efflux RND transporter periplasmic adaptor subunit [bacterium]|nr:efflux RND transporter periplasmic adaptor subunit [bacterium]